ncbi:hypothetical protein MAR_033480, partial [Mya arenaria]
MAKTPKSKLKKHDLLLLFGDSLPFVPSSASPTLPSSSRYAKSETCTNDKRGIAKDLEFCKGCLMTWQEELEIDRESIWIQCDICDGWLHSDCIADSVAEDESFQCPDCTLKT